MMFQQKYKKGGSFVGDAEQGKKRALKIFLLSCTYFGRRVPRSVSRVTLALIFLNNLLTPLYCIPPDCLDTLS